MAWPDETVGGNSEQTDEALTALLSDDCAGRGVGPGEGGCEYQRRGHPEIRDISMCRQNRFILNSDFWLLTTLWP